MAQRVTGKEIEIILSYLRLRTAFSISTNRQKTLYAFRLRTFFENCKVPASINITKAQETALLNLRKDESVKVLPADEGRSIVVMDSDEYKEKLAVLLNDTKTYLKLTDKRLNPTSSVEKDLNKILLKIKHENNGTAPQFSPNLYRKLHCSSSTPASFYGLLKIRKPGRPLRPITSNIGTSNVYSVQISGLSPVASEKKHLHRPKQFRFYTANKTAFHQQERSQGLLRCEVSVHPHTCGLSPHNNQGKASTGPQSSGTFLSFC